jgi:hypothetical protein
LHADGGGGFGLAGWALAAIGFYFQWCMGFGMPFPLNIILFPFGVAEWYIKWDVAA